jgi:hypothetical protein
MTAVTEKLHEAGTATSRMAAFGFAFIAGACVLFYEALATSGGSDIEVVWGAAALATYMVGLLCLAGASQGAGVGIFRWKIGPWLLIWYAVTFGVATLTWHQPQTSGVASEIAVPSVLRALWVVAVGITAWFVGYMLGPGQVVLSAGNQAVAALCRRFTGEVRSLAAPWILYAVGLAARLVTALSTGLLGYVGNVSSSVTTASGYQGALGALALCAPLAVAAASLQVFRDRVKGARITLAVLFLAEVGFGAAAGNKKNFIVAVLAVVIPFGAAHRRLPRAALTGLIITFLVVVVPFNQAYRSIVRQGAVTLTPYQSIAVAPAALEQTVASGDLVNVALGSADFLIQRIREIDNVAIVVQRTPMQVHFVDPIQLIEAPVLGMIPRALWPGKPILATGYQFSQTFYELPASVYTSSADTMVGGLYWFGGWASVIVGMMLFGAVIRFLDKILDVWTNPHAIFLILLLFPVLVGGETDWSALLGAVPATLLVWLLSVAIIFRSGRRV